MGEGGRVYKSNFVDSLMTVGGEGGSRKVKMLTLVDGKRGGRAESKNLKVLLLTAER